jgi:hypothetical protein
MASYICQTIRIISQAMTAYFIKDGWHSAHEVLGAHLCGVWVLYKDLGTIDEHDLQALVQFIRDKQRNMTDEDICLAIPASLFAPRILDVTHGTFNEGYGLKAVCAVASSCGFACSDADAENLYRGIIADIMQRVVQSVIQVGKRRSDDEHHVASKRRRA